MVESLNSQYLADFSAVQIADDWIGNAQSMQIAHHRVQTLLVDIVGDQAARVPHQSGQIGGFTAWCRAHVKDFFVFLRGQCHHGQHTWRALDHVVTGQVLGCGADRHLRVVDNQSHLGPFAYGVQINAAVDECLRQIATTGLQRVCAYGDRPLHFIGLKELNHL